MKLPPRRSTGLVSWILAAALTVSPLVAQNPPELGSKPVAIENHDAAGDPQDQDRTEPATAVASTATPTEEAVAPNVSGDTGTGAPYTGVAEASTPASAGTSTGTHAQEPRVSSPGESKWIILAAIVVTGAVVAAILLLRGFGGGHKSHPETVGTVITAGPPTVSTPNK